MSPRSRIELDPRLKEVADAAIRRGCTVDELVDALAAVTPAGEEPISRPGAGRYFKKMRATIATHLEAQAVRKQWIDEFGKDPDGDIGQLLVALLQTTAFSQLKLMGDQPADLTGKDGVGPRHIALLAGALKDLSSAKKIDAERILKIRRETAEKAAAAVQQVARKQGLSAETIKAFRDAALKSG